MDNSLSKNFVSNTFWMMSSKIYSMMISLVVGALSARYLGPSNYGLLNYGTALISFFTVISSLGLSTTLVVELVKKPEKQGAYIGTSLLMRLLTSIGCFFGVLGLVAVFEPGDQQLLLVTGLQAIAVILNTYEVLLDWFQVKLKMKYVTIASMMGLTATGIWRISLLANQSTVEFFALSTSVSALVNMVCVIWFFVKDDHPKLKVSLAEGAFLVKRSYHFVFSGLAIMLYSQLDRIMLGKLLTNESVGYYSAAMTLAMMWEFIPTALFNSSRPILTNTRLQDRERYLQQYKLLLLGVSLMSIEVSVGFLVLGKLAVYIFYGSSYMQAVPALKILIWSTSFAMIGSARLIWLINEDLGQYEKYFTILGGCLNVVLNALCIPLWGITGAAMATMLSQLFVALIAPLFFPRTRAFVGIYFSSFLEMRGLMELLKNVLEKMRKK